MISGITINQLANDFRKLQNRITLCIANDGGHMETYTKLQYNLKKYRFSFSNLFYKLFLLQIRLKL